MIAVGALLSAMAGLGVLACNHPEDVPLATEPLLRPLPDHVVSFAPFDLPIKGWNLFDLGAVDVDGDGHLDLFSSNHNSRQCLLLNAGGFSFHDKLTDLGLDQMSEVPGMEDSDATPRMDQPGLYIYFHTGRLVLEATGLEEPNEVRGEIEVYWGLKVSERHGFVSQMQSWFPAPKMLGTRVEFRAAKDGMLALFTPFLGAPIRLTLDSGMNMERVYLGQHQICPTSRNITLRLRDRHGSAWADLNDDGYKDVLMVRGGLKGGMLRLPETFHDELFVWSDGAYRDRYQELGFTKEGRRSRRVAWVDANGDGHLDAYVECQLTPDQLFVREADGRFRDAAKEFALNASESGALVWLDVDRDHDMDLLAERGKRLLLYVNADGAFSSSIVDDSMSGAVANFSISDFDGDGDLDVFAASRTKSRLLLNVDGRLSAEAPEAYGLPVSAAAASWVDFDNDGFEDLFTVPGGLFRQVGPGQFQATGLLDRDGDVFEARCTWADLDNDGFRDLIAADRPDKQARDWRVQAYRSTASPNHWLQLRLIGPAGNRPAIGAVAAVEYGGRESVQMVGHAEGAHYSQGHYRLYFGLGTCQRVDTVRVTWPNGSTRVLRDVAANTLLTIKQE